MKAFHREGYGRQSMSEKRKGHIDPRQLEIYQRARASKEQKEVKGQLLVFLLVVNWALP